MTTAFHQAAHCSTQVKQLDCTGPRVAVIQTQVYPLWLFTVGVCMRTPSHIHSNKYTHFPTFQGWFVCSQAFVEYISAVSRASTRTHRKQLDRWDKSASVTPSPCSITHTHTHTYLCNWLSHISCSVNHTTLRLGVRGTGLLRFPWNTHTYAHTHIEICTQAGGQGGQWCPINSS